MLTLADAKPLDAGAIGAILSEHVDLSAWHPRVYSRAEEIHFADRMISFGWVRIARLDRRVVGFMARDQQDIRALFVRASAQRKGIGNLLINDAKRAGPGLVAWCYEANIAARRFYNKAQFIEDCRTEGAENDLKLPDIKYIWSRDKFRFNLNLN